MSEQKVQAALSSKTFTATRAREREELGEVVTRWLKANPEVRVVDAVATQSSDREFHCLSLTVFFTVG